MKTIKQKHLYLSIFICVFVLNFLMSVHAEQQNPGVERLKAGIESYEDGSYEEAIFKLEMALIELPDDDKENTWEAHFYLGLSYYLSGEDEQAKREFNKAKEIFKNKLPDPDLHSPKIVKLFKEALEIKKPEIEGMVIVKGGCFDMGDTFGDGDKDEKPVHEVCVDDFYIGKYEVTQKEWMDIMGINPSYFTDCDDCPVEQVSWNDV